MPRKPAAPVTELVALDELEDLATLRRDAARYRWLRERAVRINGSEVWWQGEYLDLRCDTGVGHIQGEFEVVSEPPAKRRRLLKPDAKLK
ncbi:hypothetical protein [Pseudomonas fulva]|uniref:hypothetical protein n=1 Tax=Pseudomonas fulva TaxID=47880 RepID=UPI002DB5603A|nr:hypothetical protein [Pseudomonas fulva]MEB8059309.1 hypothetical protein [Pseudomonas fulva]